MPGTYQYDVEIKSNVAKLLSDMKQVQDRLDTVEGKEYKIKLNVDEKKLSSVISNLEKMLDSLGKGTGDFKQFETLSKDLAKVTSELSGFTKAFGKIDNSGTKSLLDMIQNIDKSLNNLSSHVTDEFLNKITSSVGTVKQKFADIGDGSEFEPLLQMINKIDSSINNLAKETSKIKLNMNLDFGTEMSEKMNQQVSKAVSRQVQAYKNLFETMKGSGKTTEEMIKFSLPENASNSEIVGAYKGVIERAEKQYGKSTYSLRLGSKYNDAKNEIKNANAALRRAEIKRTNSNGVSDLLGGNFGDVINELSKIAAKLDEISSSASGLKSAFETGFNVSASVEEIAQLTNKVKKLEDELQKVKSVSSGTVSTGVTLGNESNISSENNPKKDAFQGDIDTSSSVKSLENLEEEIKKIFTDANELQEILDSLHNGKYFHLSWTTDGIDATGADERVRQLSKLLKEYGYTINNFKSDSDAFDTSGVINAVKEESNVLEQNTQKVKENTQAKEQNVNVNLNKYDKRLDSYNGKIDKYKTTISRFNDGGWTSNAYSENVQAVKNAVKEYEDLLNELKGKDASLVTSEDINKLDSYEKKIKDTIATVTNMSAAEKGYNFVSGQKELDKIHKLLNENSRMSSEAKAKIKAYYKEIESGNPSMSLDRIHGEIMKIYNAEVEAGRAGRSFFDTLKNSGFHQIAAQMAGMFGVYDVINLGKEGFNVVRELNTALTEMRKVSDETVQSLKDYQATTFDTADEVGTTAKQIQNSTADWMRLGESMNQAAESAKDANVLLNVSEFEGIDEATESLVSMSQAYKDLDKMDIIDVLNNIGNNYSISTDGLATALKNSASALVTANNDLNEAVSLTTAGNAITQDPSKVGAGLRTISLRLVGTEKAKQELSDLGEETDGMITTVSKLRDTIMDATKAASSDGKGFDILDSNGNYKSTYEIMQGLADLYDNIVKKDKELGTNNLNLLLETIAGKNRSNIAASILQNGDMLRSVYEDAQNSEGSAEKELNSYLDSIDGRQICHVA